LGSACPSWGQARFSQWKVRLRALRPEKAPLRGCIEGRLAGPTEEGKQEAAWQE